MSDSYVYQRCTIQTSNTIFIQIKSARIVLSVYYKWRRDHDIMTYFVMNQVKGFRTPIQALTTPLDWLPELPKMTTGQPYLWAEVDRYSKRQRYHESCGNGHSVRLQKIHCHGGWTTFHGKCPMYDLDTLDLRSLQFMYEYSDIWTNTTVYLRQKPTTFTWKGKN